jgi:SAM-dependent methyltransferase
MSVPHGLFDEDYLYFYAQTLTDERCDVETASIVRLLELAPGMRVLDVPCGEGRIAGRLARHGCDVVGIDVSEHFLALARERYPGPVFEHGDMRTLDYRGEFDAVVNWFTSFGYFDAATNDSVLAGFARALRPGGRLLVDLQNPDRIARLAAPANGTFASVHERDGDLMVDRVRYDPADTYSHSTRYVVRAGNVRKIEFSLEQIPAAQLTQRLQQAGFSDVRLVGCDGEPFGPQSARMIALARRSALSPLP